MGFIRNECLVVTGRIENIEIAHAECRRIFEKEELNYEHPVFGTIQSLVSEIIPGMVNRCATFMIAVDGSKEGWHESDVVENGRNAFINWLKNQDVDYDWALVLLGGDDHLCKILASSRGEEATDTAQYNCENRETE